MAELADAAGIPARTVRYYIARGLLEGPEKAGRGASYSARHLEQLERIQRMQSGGRTLVEIARELRGSQRGSASLKAAPWWKYEPAGDIVVMVRADSSPWRLKQVRAALEEFAARVQIPEEPDQKASEKE
jgi:DNA-binding transcriptional MerR regulator